MKDSTVITLLIAFFFLLGLYCLYMAVKDKLRHRPARRPLHRLARSIWGYTGERIYTGLVGVAFMGVACFFLFHMHLKPLLGEKYNKKTESITLYGPTIYDVDSTIVKHPTMYGASFKHLNSKQKRLGDDFLLEYEVIKFTYNYLPEIPEIVWKMKNLKVINLAKNEVTHIPIDKIKSLQYLETIVVTDNPLDSLNLLELKTLDGIRIEEKAIRLK